LHDSQLFNKELYYRLFRAIRKLVVRKAPVKEQPQVS
jgi:lipopolysaccharide export system permease protein